jgi:hypothetical protein
MLPIADAPLPPIQDLKQQKFVLELEPTDLVGLTPLHAAWTRFAPRRPATMVAWHSSCVLGGGGGPQRLCPALLLFLSHASE